MTARRPVPPDSSSSVAAAATSRQQQQQQQQQQTPPPEWDRLLSAAQQNDASLIRTLVLHPARPVPPGHSNAVGQSALHIASLWGHVGSTRALLELGAPPDAVNRITGGTPLHCAVSSSKLPVANRIECARLLIECGADVGMVDKYGATPLDCLEDELEGGLVEMTEGEVEEFRTVLGGGGGDGSEETTTGIFGFIDAADVEAVKGLVLPADEDEKAGDAGDDGGKCRWQEEVDRDTGRGPLHYAVDMILSACQEQQEQCDEAEEGGDDSNAGPKRIGDLVAIVQALLKGGADPNAAPAPPRKRRGRGGIGSLGFGEENMLSNGGNGSDDDGSNLPLHQVCSALIPMHASAASSTSTNDDDEGGIGRIPHLENLASLLVSHGAAVHPPTTYLLHDACRRSNLGTVHFLLDTVGVDVNARGRMQGLRPLHFAARSGRVEVVRVLLSYRPKEEPTGAGGANGARELKAVDVNAVDDGGRTALDAARANDKEDVVALLEEAAAAAE